mmetsp:Transcript_5629/g.10148  ORF Transcript_5629/g.10148 Transcript_5629/m.10148 type:complete len:329 (+) Transcript_5629:172-1158(+)|eukprot:CAMPEP_0167791952 /NCGR_PEP_ID=MMETSP0111_2-20121227/12273_1 /TAXON_ID=91324 /ORGANISM="Lotharella globosa, Strain CCCM811" /LENGTH=328 /DNA_ID=CAMNT_0007684781 /DNA_START=309 /DNA_END=1295 /DNA_ORIENTATION=+
MAQPTATAGKIRKSIKIPIPVDKYPQYNFVGRLLGPRGSTLKQMQRETGTWIRIRGRGSMRNKQEEARIRGMPGNEHLNEPLHVHIEAQQEPGVVDAVLEVAKSTVQTLLVPVEESKDTHKKEQLRQLAQVRQLEQMGGSVAAAEYNFGSAAQAPYSAAAAAQMQQYAAAYYPYYQQQQNQAYAAYYQQGGAGAPGAAGAPGVAGAGTTGGPGAVGGVGDTVTGGAVAATVHLPQTASTHKPPGVHSSTTGLTPPELQRKLQELQAEMKEIESQTEKKFPNCKQLLSAEISRVSSLLGMKIPDGHTNGGAGPIRTGGAGSARYHPYQV